MKEERNGVILVTFKRCIYALGEFLQLTNHSVQKKITIREFLFHKIKNKSREWSKVAIRCLHFTNGIVIFDSNFRKLSNHKLMFGCLNFRTIKNKNEIGFRERFLNFCSNSWFERF
jgi:hypothetical protein